MVRLIGTLVLVILGSIAAQELYKALVPLIPILIVIALVSVLLGWWGYQNRRF